MNHRTEAEQFRATLAAPDESEYVDYPSPHDNDCDCEGCVTFYAERNKS